MQVEVTHPPLRILYVAIAYDYGNRAQGRSFEHWNFYDSLRRMGHEILYFDYATRLQQLGRERMNASLIEAVATERPDVLFFVPFNDEIDPETIERITRRTGTVTVAWFCDDHWRFEHSRHYAPHFDWSITTAQSALPKYAALGYDRVIKSQWACNHFLYTPSAHPPAYDVSFIGMAHGYRPQLIESLVKAGIRVNVWGKGWSTGRLTQPQIIEVYGRSRINLNLSNASTPNEDGLAQQIKGRNFEIPGCRGFQLSGVAEDLDAYFRVGEEIVLYDSPESLLEQIRYYLAHEAERQEIAEAGYRRVLAEHTYVHRFNEIFGRIQSEDPKAANWGKQRAAAPTSRGRRRRRTDYPLTSIIMLNRDGGEKLVACLESVVRWTDVPYELLMIDNASTDGSREYLRNVEIENMTLIENPENIGCPPARAQALALARGDYLVFLDNDTIVTPNWLRSLVEHCEENPTIGMIGPRTNNISGPQRLAPEEVTYENEEELIEFAQERAWKYRGQLSRIHRLVGFCMFFTRAVVDRIGSCDPRFGKYGYEDDDYTWRTALAGFETVVAHDVFVHHFGSSAQVTTGSYLALMEEAWAVFRDKWLLPNELTAAGFGQLQAQFAMVRPFDPNRDYIPLMKPAEVEPLIVRRPSR